jgi:hypothetical protein
MTTVDICTWSILYATTCEAHSIYIGHLSSGLPSHVIHQNTSPDASGPFGPRLWRWEPNLWRVRACLYKRCASSCSHGYVDQLVWCHHLPTRPSSHKWREQLLRMFGPELIRIDSLINSLIKTAQSAVSKNCVECGCCFAASAAIFWKHDISSASERVFPGFFGDIFGCSTLSKMRCFSTQEFTRFLSIVSSQRRTTRSEVYFQT